MQVRITYASACQSFMLELGKTYQLVGMVLYREPDIINEAINICLASMATYSPINIGDINVPVTWKKAKQYKRQNKFFLERVSNRNNGLHRDNQIAPAGIFYMPYDWFEFKPFYYNLHHGFITEHRKRIVSHKIRSLQIEDNNFTHTTEDPEKKKQALEIFHNLINKEEEKVAKRDQVMNDYYNRLAEIDVNHNLEPLRSDYQKLDPLKKIREEYEMVKNKLLS